MNGDSRKAEKRNGDAKAELKVNAHDSSWKDVLAGGMSGGLTRMLIAPLDVIKIRFQVQISPELKHTAHASFTSKYYYSGIFDCVRRIWQDEGFLAFWNGNLLAELLYIGYVGAQFGSYALIHDQLMSWIPLEQRESSQAKVSFVSGGFAALAAISATYPLDLLRTRFAAQSSPRTYHTISDAVTKIHGTDGLRGFYAGWGPTCLSLVPSMAIQFALYDWAKRTWFGGKEHGNPILQAVAGAMAGTISKLAVLPLDVLKRRLQIQGLYHHRSLLETTEQPASHRGHTRNSHASSSNRDPIIPRPSMRHTIQQIYIHEGLPGFFRGAVPSALKAGVSASLTFTFYEQSKRFILHFMSSDPR